MSTPAKFGLSPTNTYQWPISVRYHLGGPPGASQLELTLNIPYLKGKLADTTAWALLHWETAIAPAISDRMAMYRVDIFDWTGMGGITYSLPQPKLGLHPGAPAARKDTPVFQLHSGRMDRFALRRFFFFGAPAEWSEGGLLTFDALARLEQYAQAWMIGMHAITTSTPIQLLLHFTDINPGGPGPFIPVGFRTVEYIRACHHTSKAPDVSLGDWPFSGATVA